MGVSFKVSKTGSRYRPKPIQFETSVADDHVLDAPKDKEAAPRLPKNGTARRNLGDGVSTGNKDATGVFGYEVSFILNLFTDGYSIAKPTENETGQQITLQDAPKILHPYDRTSETLFSAIECGKLPGDILNDIPCKYVNGTLICEVRDYRKCGSEPRVNVPSGDGSPNINKVLLKMSLENVVKDIPLISDNAWTYGDLMEVESRILKACQPQLCLDPIPKLDRLCDDPYPSRLNLALCSLRRKRLRQRSETIVTSNDKIHEKKVCIDRGDSGPGVQQHVYDNLTNQNIIQNNMIASRSKGYGSDVSSPAHPLVSYQPKYQVGIGNTRTMQDHGSGPALSTAGASPGGQDMMIPYVDNMNSVASSVQGRRDQDVQLSPLSSLNKRTRHTPAGSDGSQQQHISSMEGFHGSDSQWKNALLLQQPTLRGIQYANAAMQKYPQQMLQGVLNQDSGTMPFSMGQQGIRYGLKEETVEMERFEKPELNRNKNEMQMMESETNHIDPQQSRLQQRIPQQFMRPNFPQTSWNDFGQSLEHNSRKEEEFQKRKLAQSPRVSGGGLPQSPLSSKSGEFSSGSIGPQFGAVAKTAALGSSQKEKSAVTSVPNVGATSLTSSANDSMKRQHQQQTAARRRSNSLPKTPGMSGVGSPASVSTMNVPLNASSPPVGASPSADQMILDRFGKIEMVTARFQLNHKKNKVDEYTTARKSFSPQQLSQHLSSDSIGENVKDDTCKMPLSKSLVGGSLNACKIRVMTFVLTELMVQGNGVSIIPKVQTRMIMSERPSDGTVAMHYGEIDDSEYFAVEDRLPTLPNTLIADLFAAQFCSLMIREGYLVEDHIQPRPIRVNRSSSNPSNVPPGNATAAETQQYSESVSSQLSGETTKPSISGNASQNSPQNISSTRMLPPANAQALQMSQVLVPGVSVAPRSQQLDQQPPMQQQQQQLQNNHLMQQQHSQFQRSSPLMIATNSLQNLSTVAHNQNMQLGNHMVNKPTALQLQLLQQRQHQQQQQQQQLQPQQQQQPQMQRKMMMGLGTVGMGNINNNMVGLGGLGNVMGVGGARGLGMAGISAPMGPISGIGNVGQNPMNLGQASNISPATLMKLRMAQAQQNRSNMLGGTQSSISGIPGARQIHPGSTGLSMLGHTLNRANINPMQQAAMGPMGPPKLMTGMNMYTNQQQQQQQQMHLQQQQQQLQQQQETSSPLQAIVSPPQVGSPSTNGVGQPMNQQCQQQQQQQLQQQASPQQISQRTPMSPQLSSGAIHPMAGNPEACPASPQMSSQTLGSVGSITNSPMDLQGVNKGNSISNV